jgi:hypothetical protein
MTSNLNKIIRTIDLANSDRREDAYESIIIDVLFNYNEFLSLNEIFDLIISEYSIKPNKNELQENVELLVEKNSLRIENGKYNLSVDFRLKIQMIFLKNQESKKIRDNNLKEIIINLSLNAPSLSELENISNAFYNYIFECFLTFGSNAINFFIPSDENNHQDNESIINKILSEFKISPHKDIFTKLLQEYPNKLNSSDLEYLTDLALKAEGFFSICLNKETYNEIQKADILDWTIFVDTNFLYSVLNLHNHPENAACKEIVELAKKGVGVKLKYIPATLSELKKKKRELEDIIPKDRYTISQLKALVSTNQIDDYAKQYYKEKLSDTNTPHPSEKIDFAQQILSANAITLFNHPLKNLMENEKFLNKRYTEYVDYLHFLNEVRISAGYDEKPDRAPDKIDHDVFLRESIVEIRGKYNEINNSKYYGITLDKILIKYDRHILEKKRNDLVNPTFFFPSFLLKRFRKLMPLETDNYKRAFVAAISSRTFDSDKPRSKVAQRTVSYFKKLGIDNEELILECINNDYFLKEVEKNEKNNSVETFLESEISKKIAFLDRKNSEMNEVISVKDSHLEQIKEEQNKKSELIKDLKKQNENLDISLKNISNEIASQKEENVKIISSYEEQISQLKGSFNVLTEQMYNDRADKIYNTETINYDKRKDSFISTESKKIIRKYKLNRRIFLIYCSGVILISTLTAISLVLKFVTNTTNFLTDKYILIVIIFSLFLIFSIIDRILNKIIDKQIFIDGWCFLLKSAKIKDKIKDETESLFESQNLRPDYNKILEEVKKTAANTRYSQ